MRSQIRNNNAVEAYQFQAQNEWRSLLCQSVLLSPSQVLLFQYKIKFIQISAIVKVKRRNQCHAWKVSYACTCGFVKCWGKSRYQKVMLYVPLSKLPQGGVRLGGSACVLIKNTKKTQTNSIAFMAYITYALFHRLISWNPNIHILL